MTSISQEDAAARATLLDRERVASWGDATPELEWYPESENSYE